MSAELFINPDGANSQAQAVLAYLRGNEGIEGSFDSERVQFLACPRVSRWENCREQGYVVTMRSLGHKKQINIAFFEHRNSDEICAIVWEQITTNAPTIDTMETGGTVYKDKYDLTQSFKYGEAQKMADFIYQTLTEFWMHNKQGAVNG